MTNTQSKTEVQIARDRLVNTVINSMRDNDGYNVREADPGVNGASRALIYAFADAYPGAFVGRVNCYTEEHKARPMRPAAEIIDDTIYNFAWCFIVPEFDQTLHDMVYARANRKGGYPGANVDYTHITEIFDRIDEIGGVNLHWA